MRKQGYLQYDSDQFDDMKRFIRNDKTSWRETTAFAIPEPVFRIVAKRQFSRCDFRLNTAAYAPEFPKIYKDIAFRDEVRQIL